MNQYLEELSQQQGIDFRANVPEGTPLGEEEIEPGADIKFKKSKSLMRAGPVSLPERQALYDLRRHDISMVPPTIAQRRMTTHPGRFTTIEPKDWHDNDPVPIDEICPICKANPLIENLPRHYSKSQLTLHCQLNHTIEWQALEDDRRDQERREDQGQMRELIASIASMVTPNNALPATISAQLPKTKGRKRGRG